MSYTCSHHYVGWHVCGIKRCKRHANSTGRVAEAVARRARVVGLAVMIICGRASNTSRPPATRLLPMPIVQRSVRGLVSLVASFAVPIGRRLTAVGRTSFLISASKDGLTPCAAPRIHHVAQPASPSFSQHQIHSSSTPIANPPHHTTPLLPLHHHHPPSAHRRNTQAQLLPHHFRACVLVAAVRSFVLPVVLLRACIHTPVRCLCSALCECERPRHPGKQAPNPASDLTPHLRRFDRLLPVLASPPCHQLHLRLFACFEAFLSRVSSDTSPTCNCRDPPPPTSHLTKDTTPLDRTNNPILQQYSPARAVSDHWEVHLTFGHLHLDTTPVAPRSRHHRRDHGRGRAAWTITSPQTIQQHIKHHVWTCRPHRAQVRNGAKPNLFVPHATPDTQSFEWPDRTSTFAATTNVDASGCAWCAAGQHQHKHTQEDYIGAPELFLQCRQHLRLAGDIDRTCGRCAASIDATKGTQKRWK